MFSDEDMTVQSQQYRQKKNVVVLFPLMLALNTYLLTGLDAFC